MGVTNGFLRLTSKEFESLSSNPVAFRVRCQQYNSPDYLDMDKAGYELLFMLNPLISDPENQETDSKIPGILGVLGEGTVVHEDIDLGYGPAQRIDDEMIQRAIREFAELDFDYCYQMASSEMVAALLSAEVDEDMFREYHWVYLKSLGEFLREAAKHKHVVLRY